MTTGEILKTTFRRSDIIEQSHDASYWQDSATLWLTLSTGVVVVLIYFTGITLFFCFIINANTVMTIFNLCSAVINYISI